MNVLKIFFTQKSFQLYFFICLTAIELLATTKVQFEVVESIWDKANHFVAFFVLYILLSLAFRNLSLMSKVVLLLFFGLQIEIVQEFIGRSNFSWFDVTADMIGIFGGLIVLKLWIK